MTKIYLSSIILKQFSQLNFTKCKNEQVRLCFSNKILNPYVKSWLKIAYVQFLKFFAVKYLKTMFKSLQDKSCMRNIDLELGTNADQALVKPKPFCHLFLVGLLYEEVPETFPFNCIQLLAEKIGCL